MLPKNICETTLLVSIRELFAGFGSGRALVKEILVWSDAPAGASTLAVIVNGMPLIPFGDSGRIFIVPVTVPDVLVQVAENVVAQLIKLVPAGSETVSTGRSAGFGPRLSSSIW